MKKYKRFIEVIVKEWYEERPDGIYMIWEFKDGTRMVRLTPYKEIPVVEWKPKNPTKR